MIRTWIIALTIALMSMSTAFAAPAWSELSPSQQEKLAQLEGSWDDLDESRRDNILAGLNRWEAMDDDGKQRTKQQFARFQKPELCFRRKCTPPKEWQSSSMHF